MTITLALYVCGTALNACQWTPPHQVVCQDRPSCQREITAYRLDWLNRHPLFYFGASNDTPMEHLNIKIIGTNLGVSE